MRVAVLFLLYGVVLVRAERREFRFIDLKLTWPEARRYCRQHHTDLATVESAEDVYRIKILSGTWAWIGLFDDPASWMGVMTSDPNSWRWSATGTTGPGGYQNWASGEPNNNGGKELCVYIQNGLWRDMSCAVKIHFFCYTVQSDTKEYFLITTGMTWADSQTYCRQHFHDLAMIQTSGENQAVWDLLPTSTTSVWIGLYRVPWRWSDGSPSGYRRWSNGEPSNSGGQEHCGGQKTDYNWNDAPCSYPNVFVCHAVLKKLSMVKLTLQTSANLFDPAVNDQLLKLLESRLKINGIGFTLSWKMPPTQEAHNI